MPRRTSSLAVLGAWCASAAAAAPYAAPSTTAAPPSVLLQNAVPGASAAAAAPSVLLQNAAVPGMTMPVYGAGTGGYTGNASQPYGAYPECFNGCLDAMCSTPNPVNFSGCGEYVDASIATWLQLGGRRVDNSASYHNQFYVGQALAASGIPRDELFVVSKVGPYLPMGFNETLMQVDTMFASPNGGGIQGGYVDLILVHWPSCSTGGGCTGAGSTPSTDPPCIWGAPTYDEAACRISTWTALVQVWKAGKARAIGVSNYNETHIEEILAAGLPLPAVNQIPFSLYHSAVQLPLIQYLTSRAIVVNGYSPFGVPDRRTYPSPMAPTELQDPVAVQIAQAHGRTVAEILLAWQWQQGIVVNPRSQNAAHMLENLGFADITLTAAEMQQLNGRPQD